MIVGMSMSPPPSPRPRRRQPTYNPGAGSVAPTGSNRFEDLLRGVGAARFNTGKALLGTVLGALDVPVQAIGGMHRDVVQGAPTGGQSAGSRALQNYGQQVGGLVSDVFRPGAGQTPLFQPREFDAAGEAAVDRFGLEGAGAGAVLGGATALDLLTGIAAGGVGSVGRGAVRGLENASGRGALNPEQLALFRESLKGNLAHGSPENIKPFFVRGGAPNPRAQYGGNFFTTTDNEIARGYGKENMHKVFMSPRVAAQQNVLDLFPGARPIAEQNPGLAALVGRTNPEYLADDVYAGATSRYVHPLANDPGFTDYLSQFDINTVRYPYPFMRLGQTAPSVTYSMQNPAGALAVPTTRNFMEALRKKLYNMTRPKEPAYDPRIDDL